MREMFLEFYSKIRKHSLEAFWKDCLIDKPQLLDLSCDGFFNAASPSNRDDDEVLSLRYANRQKGGDFADDPIVDHDFDAELLGLGRGLGTHDYIGQRVLQVASILRNLSFTDDNLLVLSKNRTFIRFLVMCANVHWNNLAMMALDMVGNIANELHLYDPTTDELTRHLMTTIAEGLESYDRGVIISCLEILSKLSQRESNEEHLYKYLEQKLYDQLARFLCLNDIMLLIYTLECIYALTSLGSKPCSALMHVAGIVDTLVALVTVEAQSYGPNACILMRVVETNYLNTNPYGSMGVASPQAATVTQLTVHNEPISSIPATITMSAEPPSEYNDEKMRFFHSNTFSYRNAYERNADPAHTAVSPNGPPNADDAQPHDNDVPDGTTQNHGGTTGGVVAQTHGQEGQTGGA
jgi:AT-rich interactive domain-containing protein 2